jgi:hypothetical protein
MLALTTMLMQEFNGEILRFKELPDNAKKAIITLNNEASGEKIHGNKRFGYVEVPIEAIISLIESYKEWYPFQDYHREYINAGDIEFHKETWAIILDDEEVIFDGWHRFHSYVEQRIKIIPCVIYI